MNNQEKLRELARLKQEYLKLREIIIYYKNTLEANEFIEKEKKQQEEVKVKKLVLTKSFHGKNLVVS
ncbi:MAG: hypothetical protein IJ501_05750 [Bacilli bacterium]|nr:hypothetical protein [Bacilli bacterium]